MPTEQQIIDNPDFYDDPDPVVPGDELSSSELTALAESHAINAYDEAVNTGDSKTQAVTFALLAIHCDLRALLHALPTDEIRGTS